MQQIRITRTNDLDNVLSYLKRRYPLLSEAEIIKMALSNQYHRETQGEEAKRSDEIPNEYFKEAAARAKEHRLQGKGSPIFTDDESLIQKDPKTYRHSSTMKEWLREQGI
jgi:hypothetical protein